MDLEKILSASVLVMFNQSLVTNLWGLKHNSVLGFNSDKARLLDTSTVLLKNWREEQLS